MLGAGLGIAPDDPRYPALSDRFLAHYANALCVGTTLFADIAELLDQLDARTIPWGIVTNKRQRYTLPLVAQLGLAERAASIVSGDSTAHPKPAPDSLLLAASQLGLPPQHCLYIGDDLRDIQAGHAAGMTTAAARYGYLGTAVPPEQWGAHHLIDHPGEILSLPTLAC
jgi:phosphoglycolate phosphatase